MPKSDSRTLRDRILDLLRLPDYQPLDKVDLSKALHIPADDRRHVRDELRELEQSGQIVRLPKDRYAMPAAENFVTGRLEIHRGGSAHVVNEDRAKLDLFIAPANMGTAMHGDTVVARIAQKGREPRREGESLEGRIERVLVRVNDTVVGTVQTAREVLRVVPDDSRFPHDVIIRPPQTEAPASRRKKLPRGEEAEEPAPLGGIPRAGDKVVVRLDPWDDARESPRGEIIEILGPAHAPGVDMLSIIRKYNLPVEFPEAVTGEAESISETIHPQELERREDLRGQFIVTIDPDDAKDYDDAVNVDRLTGRNGELTGWRLGVHIADVSHYVRLGTALDKEANRRGNSTYLADRVIPMLPERLSNGICSLKPQVDRLTFSAFVDFTKEGRIKSARFAKTVICSAARLSYRQAFAILQGKSEMPPLPPAMTREARGKATLAEGPHVPVDPRVAEAVRTAWELASLLRRNRFADGSLDLDFPEVKVWLDDEGRAVKLERVENDISHQLIEECMLVANEVVAREVKNRQVPAVYRIHEDPDPEKLVEFRETAATHGFRVGDLTLRPEVQKLLAAIKGSNEEFALKLQFLKSLKRAAYAVTPLGHYGLAKVNYTHFTSPIRRYADLVVHRSLEGIVVRAPNSRGRENGKPRQTDAPTSIGSLAQTAAHISVTERNSSDAEKDSTLLKKMEFFQRQLTSRSPDEFRAVIVEVRTYGLFVELPDVSVSGLIHVSDLPEDYYVFDPTRRSFIGRRTQRAFRAGDELPVIVSRVDAYKRQMDFVPVPGGSGGGAGSEERGARGAGRGAGGKQQRPAQAPQPAQSDRSRGGRGARGAKRDGQGTPDASRGGRGEQGAKRSVQGAPNARRGGRRTPGETRRGPGAQEATQSKRNVPPAIRSEHGTEEWKPGERNTSDAKGSEHGTPKTKRGGRGPQETRGSERGAPEAKRGASGGHRPAADKRRRQPSGARSGSSDPKPSTPGGEGEASGKKRGRSGRRGGSGRRRSNDAPRPTPDAPR